MIATYRHWNPAALLIPNLGREIALPSVSNLLHTGMWRASTSYISNDQQPTANSPIEKWKERSYLVRKHRATTQSSAFCRKLYTLRQIFSLAPRNRKWRSRGVPPRLRMGLDSAFFSLLLLVAVFFHPFLLDSLIS